MYTAFSDIPLKYVVALSVVRGVRVLLLVVFLPDLRGGGENEFMLLVGCLNKTVKLYGRVIFEVMLRKLL